MFRSRDVVKIKNEIFLCIILFTNQLHRRRKAVVKKSEREREKQYSSFTFFGIYHHELENKQANRLGSVELEKSTHTHPPRQSERALKKRSINVLCIASLFMRDCIASHDGRRKMFLVLIAALKEHFFSTIDFLLTVLFYHCHSHDRLCFPTTTRCCYIEHVNCYSMIFNHFTAAVE